MFIVLSFLEGWAVWLLWCVYILVLYVHSEFVVNNLVVVPRIVLSDFLLWLRHSSQIEVTMVLLHALALYSKLCPTLQYRTTPTLNYLLGYELDQHEHLLLLFCHEENYVVYMKIITYYCIHAYILFCMKVKSCILWNTILVVQCHTLSKECVRVSKYMHTYHEVFFKIYKFNYFHQRYTCICEILKT